MPSQLRNAKPIKKHQDRTTRRLLIHM